MGVLLATAGCVEPISVDGKPCPCGARDYLCCPFSNTCLRRGDVCRGPADARFAPLREGARWAYRSSFEDPDGHVRTVDQVQIVGPLEDVPVPPGAPWDKKAFRVRTESSGRIVKESWQDLSGNQAMRYHEIEYLLPDEGPPIEARSWWLPGRLRIDEDPGLLVKGADYEYAFDEVKPSMARKHKVDSWWVEAADAIVTVDAGTFPCLVLRRNNTRTYWFARGVGKVKELDQETLTIETDELTEFTP